MDEPPLRVLQVMECTIGGTRRHLRDLVHGLVRRGVEVEVACAVRREPRMRDDVAAMEAAGVVVHEIPFVRPIRPLLDVAHAARLAAVCWDRRFDVLHTHSSKAGALGRAVGLLGSTAVRVHTPHTYAAAFEGKGQGGEDPGPRGLILATERILGRVTHALVHVSAAEREEGAALRAARPGRAHVVPNGIRPGDFAAPSGGAALRAELGIPPGAPLVGTIGLLNDAKGHDVLIDAAARLPVDVHVLVVGHGELEQALAERARRLGLVGRVHLAGWRDDIGACHDALDVFVLPSRWEGLSYALLEAMAAGRPCVSTDVNGSAEALDPHGDDPAGVLVPVEDPIRLADAIAGLLGDPDRRRRLGRAAVGRVARLFTVDRMVDETLALYRRLLAARSRASRAPAGIGRAGGEGRGPPGPAVARGPAASAARPSHGAGAPTP